MGWRRPGVLVTLAATVGMLGACSDLVNTTTHAGISVPATQAPPSTDPPPASTTSPPTAITSTTSSTTLPPSTTVTPQPVQIRVLSYNIHHGEGEDHRIDVERIAEVIRSVSPDIVGLQEFDQGTERSDGVDQAAVIAQLTGMEHVFSENLEYRGGGFGNAILSAFPIRSFDNVLLPLFGDGEQRGVVVADLELPGRGAGTMLFLSTHLDSRDPDGERVASAEEINALLDGLGGGPAVLAGDHNDIPGSAPLRAFARSWVPAGDRGLPTFPVGEPEKQIDFVLVSPAERWKVVDVRVLDEPAASHHRLIFAVLELQR
jgi:endonuclease/exonuclease/phosphatase family metal-dependent hydrolase